MGPGVRECVSSTAVALPAIRLVFCFSSECDREYAYDLSRSTQKTRRHHRRTRSVRSICTKDSWKAIKGPQRDEGAMCGLGRDAIIMLTVEGAEMPCRFSVGLM